MGYYTHDSYGYVADGPNLTGWRKLRDTVLIGGGPATAAFVADRVTEDVEGLQRELAALSSPDRPVQTSLERLRKAVNECRELVILAEGAGDVDDEVE